MAKDKYYKYPRLNIPVDKEFKQKIKVEALLSGETMKDFVIKAINKAMEQSEKDREMKNAG